jgi:hypothetical protein
VRLFDAQELRYRCLAARPILRGKIEVCSVFFVKSCQVDRQALTKGLAEKGSRRMILHWMNKNYNGQLSRLVSRLRIARIKGLTPVCLLCFLGVLWKGVRPAIFAILNLGRSGTPS